MHPLVIAEVGLCHDGSFARACEHIRAAKQAGADIVKFQKRSDPAWFRSTRDRPLNRMSFGWDLSDGSHRAALEFTDGQHIALSHICRTEGIGYGCSYWDAEALLPAVNGPSTRHPGVYKIGRPTALSERFVEILACAAAISRVGFLVSCRDYLEEQTARKMVEAFGHYFAPIFCPGGYPDKADELAVDIPEWARGVSFHTDRAAGPFTDAISHFADREYQRIAVRKGPVFNYEYTYVEAHVALGDTKHSDREYSLSFNQLKSLCDYTKLRRTTHCELYEKWAAERKEEASS